MSNQSSNAAELALHSRAVQYIATASVTILAYDCIITLADEVELVWSSKWNMVKLLFLGTRYLPMLSSLLAEIYYTLPRMDNRACARIYNTSTALSSIGIALAIAILCVRIHALWGRSRKILIVLSVILSATFIFGLVVFTVFQNSVKFSETSIRNIVSCSSSNEEGSVPVPAYAIYVIIMFLDSIVVSLALYKAVSQWRRGEGYGSLLKIFHRDGLVYFICMFSLSGANVIINIFEFARGDYNRLLLQLQCAFHSIISARMVLNLRNASSGPLSGNNTTSLDTMQFAACGATSSPNAAEID